jgi:putative membrane protein
MALWGTWNVLAADTTSQLDHKDSSFIKEASQGGMAEIELGKLAADKAQNADLKQYGQHLQQDHTKANQELAQIAQRSGVTLPAELNHKENREADKLQEKTGAEFDKAFAEYAIKDHEKDIDRYQKALRDTKDADLRAWIEKNLPVLQQHLQMARNVGATVGVDQKTLATADKYLSAQTGGVGTAPGSETGTSVNRNQQANPPETK